MKGAPRGDYSVWLRGRVEGRRPLAAAHPAKPADRLRFALMFGHPQKTGHKAPLFDSDGGEGVITRALGPHPCGAADAWRRRSAPPAAAGRTRCLNRPVDSNPDHHKR